jgi:hypothetical protein
MEEGKDGIFEAFYLHRKFFTRPFGTQDWIPPNLLKFLQNGFLHRSFGEK